MWHHLPHQCCAFFFYKKKRLPVTSLWAVSPLYSNLFCNSAALSSTTSQSLHVTRVSAHAIFTETVKANLHRGVASSSRARFCLFYCALELPCTSAELPDATKQTKNRAWLLLAAPQCRLAFRKRLGYQNKQVSFVRAERFEPLALNGWENYFRNLHLFSFSLIAWFKEDKVQHGQSDSTTLYYLPI